MYKGSSRISLCFVNTILIAFALLELSSDEEVQCGKNKSINKKIWEMIKCNQNIQLLI